VSECKPLPAGPTDEERAEAAAMGAAAAAEAMEADAYTRPLFGST